MVRWLAVGFDLMNCSATKKLCVRGRILYFTDRANNDEARVVVSHTRGWVSVSLKGPFANGLSVCLSGMLLESSPRDDTQGKGQGTGDQLIATTHGLFRRWHSS